MTLPPVSQAAIALRTLNQRWRSSPLGEKQAFQLWFIEFCDALGVARPSPAGNGSYCFEQPVKVLTDIGNETTNFIDCWKAGHIAVEAKASGGKGTNDIHLRKAYKQLTQYVAAEPGTVPPYLMVVDVPHELIIWEGWRGGFGGFAAGRRIRLDALPDRPDDIALLQDVFERPQVRDPRGKAQQVTREIAGKLAELAATFEGRGFESERVARFLMRCVFCFFAEDVGLLPPKLFEQTLDTARETGDGEHVARVLTDLWRLMDSGGMFGAQKIQRFNGHFFKTIESLPLEAADVQLLIDAARFDWSQVEPSIFGTLLVRALEPSERHKLGAEYTPREYIERLVEPTVVEPLRERWTAVQAHMAQLEQAGKKKDLKEAEDELLAFHKWLRGLQFLDPACGSGNFLYVTMAAVKRIELEVLAEVARLHGGQEGLVLDEVHPRQFHGIEVNWWAREIAELTLWIGYHQFWREAHGGRTPPVPILEDTGTIECRDAILAWDSIVHRPEKDRPDPTPRIVSPVTGELIPDPTAKLPYMEYVGARQAEWPKADFIIGNPPYIGQARQREALGDGYVDAIRQVYPEIEDTVDLVMYWWGRAATETLSHTTRAGLITTKSISQVHNRGVVARSVMNGVSICWASVNHPWIDDSDGAAVRVTFSVVARATTAPARIAVLSSLGRLEVHSVARIGADFTAIDILSAAGAPLLANGGMAHRGYQLIGLGFLVDDNEARRLRAEAGCVAVIRPYLHGRDIAQRARGLFVIDFGLNGLEEARRCTQAFQVVLDRVKPQRDSNARDSYRKYWWRFGEPRPELRDATQRLGRMVVTAETMRHRLFTFVDTSVAPDNKLVCIAHDDAATLGVLSSSIHVCWATAAGSRLGVGNDPVYAKRSCFDPFPFPDPPAALRDSIGALAEKLDQHRKDAIARDERVTMTGMYNVVEKLRSGEALTHKERAIHEIAACGILRDLHDELDALVATAYGWPWPMEREEILERLVALHDERVAEEKRGHVHWLRPEYQIPRFAPNQSPVELDLPDAEEAPVAAALLPWPATMVEQIAALTSLVSRGPVTVEQAMAAFAKADKKLVSRHLETLTMLGEVREEGGAFGAVRGVG
ncbi:MAG: DNA methyltransferase [Gemmatimonadales bacterium]